MNRMVRLFVCSLNLIEQKIPKHNFWKLQVAQGIRHLFISPIHMGYFSTQLCLVIFHLKIREIIVFHLCYTKTFDTMFSWSLQKRCFTDKNFKRKQETSKPLILRTVMTSFEEIAGTSNNTTEYIRATDTAQSILQNNEFYF